ncbi:Predicted dehydrogenase [Marinitoga hydrogenitolerans DSM 16785]|uniref:Predicted dehydrogenase n=1 Tax=Marinitoga hydrogenitolerans (strain DSM 16785 / JCM 12826 / AT1271) TaxID=1122195 RepID=A0A1M4YX49_MARH1|nr:bi-domain-containing oxidoreductase [Marinitoga hydrogenitolerans]SHF10363.1 Predicted dehydrogenase [Marinitoga hydrogenitolerans DSM 16785]
MKQIFADVKTGETLILDVPAPSCKKDGILIETLYSLVSAGTERMLIDFGKKNLIQKAKERPDQVKKVLDKMLTDGVLTTLKAAFNKLDEPLPLGYSAVGKVIEVGKNCIEFQKGDLVAIAGAANHAEINYVPKNLAVKLPNNFENLEEAAFVALGAIAMQGIKQAEIQPGEKVAVIGLGLLGQIVSQILNAYGNIVIGIDIDDSKYEIGKDYIHHFINSNEDDAIEKIMNITDGYGVDKIIITAATSSNQPIDFAGDIARDRAIISMVGVTGMNIPRRSFYQKELTFRLSRSYGPGRYDENYEERGIDYPIGYVRWTENRIMQEFIRLIYEKKINMKKLITHEFDITEAKKAYELITDNPNKERYTGVLIKYSENKKKYSRTINITKEFKKVNGKIGIGLIGAGNFVKSTMLPHLSKINDFELIGLSTGGSSSSGQTIKKYEFKYATTDYTELLKDENIDLIIIATPHNTHAKFVIEALDAGKHVYVEKPLAINEEQLEKVKEAYERNNQHLIVGFNRRFSPFAQWIKKELQTDKFTTIVQYTINAGTISKEHWINNPEVGGGRIIGEVCHFIDLCQYIVGSEIEEAEKVFITSNSEKYINNDNVSINLKFKNGSIANIIYTSMGTKSYPKENIRIFTNGNVAEIHNFVKAEIYKNGKKKTKKKLEQDKGFVNEYKYIRDIIKGKRENNYLTFNEIYQTTLSSF